MADSPKTGNQEFGDLLREAREDRGMSRRDLAEATGLSYPYISQLETGYRMPSPTAIQTLSRVLHVSLDAIFAAMTNPTDQPPAAPRRRLNSTPLGWVENGSFATDPAGAGSPVESVPTPDRARAGGAVTGARMAMMPPAAAQTPPAPRSGQAPSEVVTAVLDLLSRVPATDRLHALAQIQAEVVKGVIAEGISEGRQS